jgi:translation initiation factor IF-3
MLGIVPTADARKRASDMGLDLVEISPNAKPPVCRIMDYGKFQYESRRKERAARKRQHSLALKEIKFHVNVDDHDYRTKVNHIREFLEKGHKVKVSLFFRGRENAHRELGFKLMNRVREECEDIANTDVPPRMVGRGIFMILAVQHAKGGQSGGKGA